MSKQPSIILHTYSGAIVELFAHRKNDCNYSARLSINGSVVAYMYAREMHKVDENLLIMEHTHIPLMRESEERAKAFFAETADYINGDPA